MDTRMPDSALKIALAQYNPVVGDISRNREMALKAYEEACKEENDLIVFSELFMTGYPPEDLILKPAFVEKAIEDLKLLAKETADQTCAILIGCPWLEGGKVYNSAVLLFQGEIQEVRHKVSLPNYGVFDEKRIFSAGELTGPVSFKGTRLGICICEDIWESDVCECLDETGADILVVLNGSPYSIGKHDVRMNVAVSRVVETQLPLVYVNQFGGQDELVFDGSSFVLNSDSSLQVQMPSWKEGLLSTWWEQEGSGWSCKTHSLETLEEDLEAIYLACVVGLRDYVNKTGFPSVLLGLSGGVDSALCAAIAVDALGPDRVHCIMLPYKYTSSESLKDAAECADSLGVKYDIIEIHEPVEAINNSLTDVFIDLSSDTTEENIQSRTRGVVLMAISNKFGGMLVTTGNKSEVSVGYATLYGDMNGGYNPIKDLYKTQVFDLCKLRNKVKPQGVLGPSGNVIPNNIITKPPTAELREGQKDQDSLPPYETLDDILECLVEKEMPVKEILKRGHSIEIVKKVQHLLYIAEYKRRQAAPGVKISERNFGRDRRYPITNKFRE